MWQSWQGDSAMVAIVSVPHCTQNCADTEVAVSPEGILAVQKLMLDVFFMLHTRAWGEGDRPVVQRCEYLQFLPFCWVLAADFWQALGPCVLLILSACVPPTSVQTFACKTEFLKKLVFYLLCVGFLTLFLCCARQSLRAGHFCTTSWHFLWSTLTAAEVRNRPDAKTTGLGAKRESRACSCLCSSFSLWLWAAL